MTAAPPAPGFELTARLTAPIKVVRVRRRTVTVEMPDGARATLRAGDTVNVTLTANADRE